MIIGYARVSTSDQNPQLQTDALKGAGCERIFTDKASGAREHRPELDHMLDLLRPGDTVVVWKLDRLGRSMKNLIDLVNRFHGMGVNFRSLTEHMDTTTAEGQLVFNIFGSFAQFERDLIRERTRAGLEAARARGRKGGRRQVLSESKKKEIRNLRATTDLTVNRIAELYNVSRSTIDRALRATK